MLLNGVALLVISEVMARGLLWVTLPVVNSQSSIFYWWGSPNPAAKIYGIYFFTVSVVIILLRAFFALRR